MNQQFVLPSDCLEKRRIESRDSPRGISDVAIGAVHESFMRQLSLSFPLFPSYPHGTPCSLSLALALLLFSFFASALPAAFRCSLWKSQRADTASYQSAESVNRRGNVFQPAPTLAP